MIKAAASPISWALFTVRPLLRWYRGRVVILGDAAHGMLPHHGQGANTSIEDAFALAALLAERQSDDLENTFSRFQTLRRARTRKIQRSSRVTSSLLHLPDGPRPRPATGRWPGCRTTSGGSTSTTSSRSCRRSDALPRRPRHCLLQRHHRDALQGQLRGRQRRPACCRISPPPTISRWISLVPS